jgi:putative ABC transport system permease protein
VNLVSDGYFEMMGIPVLSGRTFDSRDTARAPRVAVVGASFARNAFPNEDAIGKRFRIRDEGDWLTVIGVVGDSRHRSLKAPPAQQVYTTHEQDPRIFACVMARTAGDPMAAAQAVRQAIWSVDPDQPVWNVRSMDMLIDTARGPSRAVGRLLAAFALVALFLAAVGLYGVLSQLVAQRTREIGIRMALGASAGRVLGLVVARGMILTAIATALGLAGAAALSRLLASLLFGVRPLDPVTFAAASATLAAAALLACWLPARRAARVDPALALAEE